MPPQSQTPPKAIKWNEVTWYSKAGAILLFLGVVPALTFYIGVQYESARSEIAVPLPQNETRNDVRTKIDEYFSKDSVNVYYANVEAAEYDGPISTTTEVLRGADAATFKRISDFKQSFTTEGMSDTAYYQDKNTTYTFSIYKGLAGVRTSIATTTSKEFLPR